MRKLGNSFTKFRSTSDKTIGYDRWITNVNKTKNIFAKMMVDKELGSVVKIYTLQNVYNRLNQ